MRDRLLMCLAYYFRTVSTSRFKEKKQLYLDIKNGIVDVIIGTHSLLNEKLSFKNNHHQK